MKKRKKGKEFENKTLVLHGQNLELHSALKTMTVLRDFFASIKQMAGEQSRELQGCEMGVGGGRNRAMTGVK